MASIKRLTGFPRVAALLVAVALMALLTAGCGGSGDGGGSSSTVGKPNFAPAPGTYTQTMLVAAYSTTVGSDIIYTTDGSTPTASHGTLAANGIINITQTTSIRAIAISPGGSVSAVSNATYTIVPKAGQPQFTPAAGIYTAPQSVAITSDTEGGATIRYTTDGTTPTRTHGTVYAAPVQVAANTAFLAVAYADGFTDSELAIAGYTITGTVATPELTPAGGTYEDTQVVTIATATPSATIRYTTDGTNPTSSYGDIYAGAFQVSSSRTVKAIAYRTNWADSAVATAVYDIVRTVQTPQISPSSGTYGFAQTVTILTPTSGATIYYTTDGTDPTDASTLYAGAFVIPASGTTIKAIAYKAGWQESAIAEATYTLQDQASSPIFSPVAGTYPAAVTVTLTCGTPASTIRYTTTGTNPTVTSGTVYADPFEVAATSTVKAICYADGLLPSPVVSSVYTIETIAVTKVATPVIAPVSGNYRSFVDVTITTTTEGATIRYTTNGVAPTATTGTLYTGPFTLATINPVTVTAVGFKADIENSDPATATYTIYPVVAAPYFDPPPGRYDTAQNLTLTSATAGAKIYYTTNGTIPSATNGTEYLGSLNVANSSVIKAIAIKTGLFDSNVTVGMYAIGAVQQADFADANLERCVREAMELGDNDPITTQMLANTLFTELDCSWRGINDINGIQNMVLLTSINLSHNAITDVTLLGGLSALTDLNVGYNQIGSVDPLRGLTGLTSLNFSANRVSDLAPLANLTNMVSLSANQNFLGDITPLAGMSLLENLDLGDNLTIANVATLALMSKLTNLDLRGNAITDAGPLADLALLEQLNLSRNRLSDLTPLADLTALTDLYLDSNNLAEPVATEENPNPSSVLYPLRDLRALRTLGVSSNQILDLYPLAGLTDLRDLDVSYNLVDDVRALSGLMKLETLSLDNNDITDVAPLARLLNLETLFAQENCITDFDTLLFVPFLFDTPQSVGCAEIPRTVSDPQLTPGTGDYIAFVDISMWSPTSGATIRYTTDGVTDPSATVGDIYEGAIRLTETTTIKAIAVRSDWTDSQIVTETYTVTPLAGTPVFSQGTGVYTGSVTFTLSTTTPGASIYYTLDGSTPTEDTGLLYGGAITVTDTTTVQAVAVAVDYAPSPIATEVFTIVPIAGAPGLDPGAGFYDGAILVTMTSATEGAFIRYTIDTTPANSDDDVEPTDTEGILYEDPIIISPPPNTTEATVATVRAVAYKDGYAISPVTEIVYVLYPTVATPSIQPGGGTFNGQVTVSILDATANAVIFYTTDGSTPNSSTGILYSQPFVISANTTVKAIAYALGMPPSTVATANFLVQSVMSDPVVTPVSGIYPGKVDVTITCESSAALLYYTTDETDPSPTNGTLYTGAFQLTASTVLKVVATSPGSTDSNIVTVNYTIEPIASAPTFTPGPGTYQGSVDITLFTTTLNATMRYTTDGSEPTATHGTVYAGRFTLTRTATVKAVAYKTGWSASPVSSSGYTIVPMAAQPYFVPGAGTYVGSVDVAIIGPTDGSTVRYTLDGTIPTVATGTELAPNTTFTLNASAVVTAVSFKAGMAPSRPATGNFVIDSDFTGVFPDPNLDACVRAALGVGPLDLLDLADLESLTELDCSSRGIASINGIQNLRSLNTLNLSDNLITDGSLVQGLIGLDYLDMSNNRLTTMAPEGYLISATTIRLNDNLISDITPAMNLVAIQSLHLAGNLIQNLTPLIPLQLTLTDIELGGNILIDDIGPLASLTFVERIGLSFNHVSDLTPLQDLDFVTYLDLGWNELTNVSDISPLTTLTELKLNNNYLTDLTPVSTLVYLTSLNLRDNLFIDLRPLAGLGEMVTLELDNNQAVDVTPLASMQLLKTLSLTNNNISDVSPLVTLVNLDTINLAGNCISDLAPVAFVPTVNATPMRLTCE